MSVMKRVALAIKDLTCLEAAAARLGLELVRDKTTFKQHASHGDDSCSHALRVRDNPSAYEVGLMAEDDGSFSLAYDCWNGGSGLMAKISREGAKGTDAGLLEQAYAVEVVRKDAERRGESVCETVREDGTIELELTIAG